MIGVRQTLGIIAMAVVILMRYEIRFQQLSIRTDGSPVIWRKLFLLCSIELILLFDILTYLATAFPDAGLMLIPAAPFAINGSELAWATSEDKGAISFNPQPTASNLNKPARLLRMWSK